MGVRLSSLIPPLFPRALGIDLGSRSIKVLELERRGGTRLVRGLVVHPMPEGALQGGTVNPEGVVPALAEALRRLGSSTRTAAMAVSGNPVFTKRVQLPPMDEEELEEVLPEEAQQYLPFPLEEVTLDAQVLRVDPERMEVLLIAAKRNLVSAYLEVARGAGVRLKVLDVDTFALSNAFEVNYPELRPSLVTLVDLGARATRVVLLREGAVLFTREVEAGRESAAEVKRTVEFFATSSGERPERCLVCGGGVQREVLEEMEALLETPVEALNPFRRVRNPHPELEGAAHLAVVALGLALRA